ncbi:CocE/NonD family hydrolase C-terminal non-catalytic domain-containing protein (plasmid) [Mycolicibacterium psychrotolerans]|uniref:CocE/NonD family hydrolase C-terminal non-catalytic domain-containing protein n=1 Tax=Mycolicibacterium psychrotolerans TaxID=216929 RepID=UPI003D66B3F1
MFHLDANTSTMTTALVQPQITADLDAAVGILSFRTSFTEDVELTGPMAVRLFVSSDGPDDVDFYVFVRKLDAAGEPLLPYLPLGVPVPGAKGQLRASHRELDSAASTDLVPVHRHQSAHPLTPGEVVSLDVPIWPVAMAWHAGEQLELLISVQDLFPTSALITGPPAAGGEPTGDNGTITLWTGASYPSRLIVNRVPS